MSNPVEQLFMKAVIKSAKRPPRSYNSDTSQMVKGILINRDPPISTGWCGNDDCEHLTHKERRSAQAAADKRATR